MLHTSPIYRFVSILLSALLLIQSVAPALAYQRTAVAQPASPAHELADTLSDQLGLEGYLLDADAQAPSEPFPTLPEVLANPISLSRVQSAYVPGDALNSQLVITYTVTNNRPPLAFPDIPAGATLTDTITLLGEFDYSSDPNTIRQVVLSNELMEIGELTTAVPSPGRDQNNLHLNLGDIPPSTSVTATLTLDIPANVTDFTPLDSGAVVHGRLQGRTVSTATSPALLAPNSFGEYLRWTPDADIYDTEMLRQLGQLVSDPLALFEYVRGFDYELYDGSLRGTRGTLWSEAGNSTDQASLLIALLRASGVPARYASGTLDTPTAQTLILSMFPAPTHVVGHIPPSTAVADPANDPDLLTQAQAHWWVQAYINGNWVNLDPSFATAQAGDTFATASETHAELPDELRHKVTLSVKVERMEPFQFNLQDFTVTYPLTATFNSVSLVGQPILFGHFVDSDAQGGLVFSNYIHTYSPYFAVGDGDELVQGDSYQDLFTDFPFGTAYVTGVWLTVDNIAPNGELESYTRELKDIYGPAARQPVGEVNIDVAANRGNTAQPLFSQLDFMQIHAVPHSQTPASELAHLYSDLQEVTPQLASAFEAVNALGETPTNEEVTLFVDEYFPLILSAQAFSLEILATDYQIRTTASDRAFQPESLLVRSYPDRAQLLLLSQNIVSDTINSSFELLNITQQTLAYPEQAQTATFTANLLRTTHAKVIEYELMTETFSGQPDSGLLVLTEALQTNVPWVLLTPETMAGLNDLLISDEAKGRINAALADGRTVVVPQQMVEINGEPTIGWLEVDALGQAQFVTEDGHYALSIGEKALIVKLIVAVIALAGTGIGALATIVVAFISAFAAITVALITTFGGSGGGGGNLRPSSISATTDNTTDLTLALIQTGHEAVAACHGQPGVNCDELEALLSPLALASAVVAPQAPLAGGWYGQPAGSPPENTAVNQRPLTSNLSGQTINGTLNTPLVAIENPNQLSWSATAVSPFAFDTLTAGNSTLFTAGGTQLGTGTASAAASQTATAVGNPLNANLNQAQGGLTFYAPATAGLSAGSQWDSYAASLNSSQPHDFYFSDTTVTLNNSDTHTGDLRLEVTGSSTLSGQGATAVPLFTTATSGNNAGGGLTIGPATGTFQLGGQAVNVGNGFALGNHEGTFSLTEANATQDSVTVSGTADFFTLDLSPATSSTPPSTAVSFQSDLRANFADTYTIRAYAPEGWSVTVDASGQVDALPPLGATPAEYVILVTAQSALYPELFVTAVHTVTTTAEDGLDLSVTADNSTTIPMGAVLNPDSSDYLGRGLDPFGQLNDGQFSVPEAAYLVNLTNRSTTDYTFDVAVNGLPAGWLLLSDAPGQSSTSLPLGAGVAGQLGFYVVPTLFTLPAPGTTYNIEVTAVAQGNPALNETANISFTMPDLPFPYLHLDPTARYAAPGDIVSFDLSATNVGNQAASFPVEMSVKNNLYSPQANLTTTLTAQPANFSTASLPPNSTETQAVTVDTTGTAIGQSYLLQASSAGAGYAPVTYGRIQIVSPESGAIFEAAESCTLDSGGLQASLETLALNVVELESWCALGDCPLPLRDHVVTSGQAVLGSAEQAAQPTLLPALAELDTAVSTLAAQTDNADILAAIGVLATAVDDLSGNLCTVEQHRVTSRFTPYVEAILLGDTANFSLDITNEGILETTYAITVTGLPSGDLLFNETIPAGDTLNLPITPTPNTLGNFNLTADVVAQVAGEVEVKATAVGRLNVVDKFVQLTQVLPDPAFVETGVSSTTLSIEVANLAGVAIPANADARFFAPDGQEVAQSDTPLTLLAGNPRTYELGSVDTSGWDEGVYTITVDLLNPDTDTLLPDGSNYGYLSVGQAVQLSQAVSPTLVAPGTLTVTTIITSEIASAALPTTNKQVGAMYDAPFTAADWVTQDTPQPTGNADGVPSVLGGEPQRLPPADPSASVPITETEPIIVPFGPPVTNTAVLRDTDEPETTNAEQTGASERNDEQFALSATGVITISPGLHRYEETYAGITYNGAWSNVNSSNYSSGSGWRSQEISATAVFTFTGEWLEIGFGETTDAGKVEVTLDGVSQGVYDLYGRHETRALVFSGLSNSQHVVTLTVVAQDNPFSNRNWVALDYLTVWDGTAVSSGTFEHDDPRVISSNGWSVASNANASGGTYGWRAEKMWFYFEGDSVGMQIVTSSSWDEMRVLVDGEFVTKFDMYRTDIATDTLSLDGFGPGLHVLELDEYRGNSTLDTFITPGVPPFYQPPVDTGYTRYEEDDPALRYNGLPFGDTASSWSLSYYAPTSNRYAADSGTLSDTVSLTFTGTAVFLGFYTSNWGGLAEVTIDGVVQEIVDTYSNEADLLTRRYADLGAGTHTITVTVLDQRNPFSNRDDIRVDFIDVWDGTGLADGLYEAEDRQSVFTSDNWNVLSDAGASAGQYLERGDTVWFPFTGDTVSLLLPADNFSDDMRLFVDDEFVVFHENYSPTFITETISLEGLGAGVHLLRLESYRGRGLADAFATPGTAPFLDPNPPVTDVTRYEEHHPSIRYNGVPFFQTATTWNRETNIFSDRSSDGQHIYSAQAGDTISFDFEGSWLGVGFSTSSDSGLAEIRIDGVLMAELDLYTRESETQSHYFDGLSAGSHTVEINVLGTSNPLSNRNRVYFDFFDVWDGQPLAEGTFEESDERIYYSSTWGQTTAAEASGGSFASSGGNATAWIPFTGDSVTFQMWARGTYHSVELKIDGVSLGHFNSYSRIAGPRAFSFDGLGSGPHVLEVRSYRGTTTLDSFTTPSTGEHYETPAPSGVIRLEEDHPDLRYDGQPYRTMPRSWSTQSSLTASSGQYNTTTSTAGNTLSLEFEGTWLGLGFLAGGEVEIFIDGASRGVLDTTSVGLGDVASVYYDDLITGTHTLSVTAVSGSLRPDFIDLWDGQTIPDGWYDADLNDTSGRFHFANKNWWGQASNQYAHDGDYLTPSLPNADLNAWFTFVGNDLTLLSFNRNASRLHVLIDGQDYSELDITAEYSNQPYSFHFSDLGDGPHVVQVYSIDFGRIDAFEVNPDGFYNYVPQIMWHDDSAATEVITSTYGAGFVSTIGIGDLDGDGEVELVAPSANGRLYVYRGDGADTGDGTPILWSSDVAGPVSEPALADLNGDGNAEIVVTGVNGTFALTHDGNVLWHNPDVASFYAAEQFGWGGASIGNLDLSPEPEIVLAASRDALYVLDHLGNTQWSVPLTDRFPTPPVLADITGDGLLDIIVADQWDLRVYDYFNGGQLVWEYTQADQVGQLGGAGAFGAPAVVDITGDGQPEIIINWGVFVEALRADGSLLWKYDTGRNAHFRPSPITVADTTGDGQMNIVTASAIGGLIILNHTLMVLDADGNLVWEQIVGDNSASASGVSAQDLTGNGVWEVIWNGATDGFLILRGSDGKRLFNEPYTWSGTVLDYPSLGDVDGDGVADVVLAGRNGLFVVSHVGHWVDSRPIWNQHNYHVTNINDDWSVPISEQNSWELHNTYRTQTPERNPSPSYQMVFTYTAGFPDVAVLTETATISMTADHPVYGWEYRQEWYQPVISTTFDSLLTDLQPGETRQVSAGTEVAYRLPSGFNYVTLPPLYVTAERLGSLFPPAQSVAVGSTAVYTLTLSNPTANPATYTLMPGGVPAEWLTYPATVNIGAEDTAVVNITVQTPAGAMPDTLPLWVDVDNGLGGTDAFSAQLTLFDALALSLDPFSQAGTTGQPLTYTLTISNLEASSQTYDLTATGLAEAALVSEVTVAANSAEMVVFTAVPLTQGPQPFNIEAVAPSGATASVDGIATGNGRFGILAEFDPDSVVTGPGATAVVSYTLSNIGDTADEIALSIEAPAGWQAELLRYGQPVTSLTLPALPFNEAMLPLLVTPDVAAVVGSYPVTVTAQSVNQPGVQATAVVMVEVSERGVTVEITPANQTINPNAATNWSVTVTNRGSVADSYALTPTGVPALAGTLTEQTGTLAPGASQTVQLSVPPLSFLVAGPYRFAVIAESVGDAQVRAQDRAQFAVPESPDVLVEWLSPSRTVTDTLTLSLGLVVTNTGNLLTAYELDLTGTGLTAVSTLNPVPLPARSAALLLVTVQADGFGEYVLTATAVGDEATASDTANLTFATTEITPPENIAPVVNAGADFATLYNTAVSFSGSFVDEDGPEPHEILWDFGDGNTASGSLTTSHSYATEGVYTVTLTVTDGLGAVGTDTLQVTVTYPTTYLPIIMRAP